MSQFHSAFEIRRVATFDGVTPEQRMVSARSAATFEAARADREKCFRLMRAEG
jgi:hypothetical protein